MKINFCFSFPIVNFTWVSHIPVDGHGWGVRPISGPFNESGIWGGSMGGVINGEYHMSLSQWIWNFDRYGLLDFVSTSANTVTLALTPQPPEMDFGLFIRPFQNEAWYCILGMLIIIPIVLMGPYILIQFYESTDGYHLISLITWLFFVLINAYYSGALTMFFTSEPTLPFNSIGGSDI